MDLNQTATMSKEYTKLEKAKKQVSAIQKFYNHLIVFVVVNIAVLVGWYVSLPKIGVLDFGPDEFKRWVFWNIILFPAVWSIILIVQGLNAYGKFAFIKRWEERKIEELMDKDEDETIR